jgi:hypothetical protein
VIFLPPRESKYQGELIRRIYERFPECQVLKNDSGYLQGIPDLTILFDGGVWAVLEVKRSIDEPFQPNQEFYLGKLAGWSFAATIYPENEEAVLNELQQKYETRRAARLS